MSNSSPGWPFGYVPTPAEWNNTWAGKVDGTGGNSSGSNVTATGSTVSRSLANRFADVVNVKDFGATGNGSHDDTANIQAAYTAVGANGGTVFWPDGLYKTSATIWISSHTITRFAGGAIIQPVPIASFEIVGGVPGLVGDFGYFVLGNENFRATVQIDDDMEFHGVRVEPTAPWGGHAINVRKATNIKVIGGRFIDLGDAVSALACDNFLIEQTYVKDITDAAWDFWETSSNITIRDNDCYNAVNAVVINTFDTAFVGSGTAKNLLVEGNRMTRLKADAEGRRASLIAIAPNPGVTPPGLQLEGLRIINNFLDMDNVTGGFGAINVSRCNGVEISGNTIWHCNGQPAIYANLDNTGVYGDVCIVERNIAIDCTCDPAAVFGILGPRARVRDNVMIRSTGAIGVQINDPTTIVGPNILSGASSLYANQSSDGTPTVPAMQMDVDTTAHMWVSKQPISAPSFIGPVDYAITATGTNAATAFPLVNTITYFSGVASGTGARLPANALSSEFLVFNAGANTLTIYPNAGASLSGSNTLAPGTHGRYVCVHPALWMVM